MNFSETTKAQMKASHGRSAQLELMIAFLRECIKEKERGLVKAEELLLTQRVAFFFFFATSSLFPFYETFREFWLVVEPTTLLLIVAS